MIHRSFIILIRLLLRPETKLETAHVLHLLSDSFDRNRLSSCFRARYWLSCVRFSVCVVFFDLKNEVFYTNYQIHCKGYKNIRDTFSPTSTLKGKGEGKEKENEKEKKSPVQCLKNKNTSFSALLI